MSSDETTPALIHALRMMSAIDTVQTSMNLSEIVGAYVNIQWVFFLSANVNTFCVYALIDYINQVHTCKNSAKGCLSPNSFIIYS